MYIQILLFIIGVAVLYAGGMVFIRGASNAAYIFNIRPIIIGLVVVAFATSAPEFCVSVLAAIKRNQSLAIGNIIGSCICNITMVLGVSAIVKPVKVQSLMLRREMPILLIATMVLFIFSIDSSINRIEAFFLLGLFIAFILYCIKNAKNIQKDKDFSNQDKRSRPSAFVLLLSGLIGLLGGAYIVVNSAVVLARYIGVSELVIGLTLVAVGTSLPELFASISAAKQGEGDIAIGNVIGSNIFNILAIVGVVGIISPIALDSSVIYLSFPVLLLFAVILVPIIKTDYTISRKEGTVLLFGYFLYLLGVLKI